MKFYQKTWFVILTLIFFAPLGIFLMIKHKPWSTLIKVILSIISLLFFIGTLVSTFGESATKGQNLSTPPVSNVNKSLSKVPAQREIAISQSNKDIDDNLTVLKNVANDLTGNLRIVTIADSLNIEEYAKSYYEKYFESDNEIHAIVNFSLSTTTQISKLSSIGNVIDVSIYEYVDKEEHDAKLLFSGMLLKEYFIYLDNGDIEEVQ